MHAVQQHALTFRCVAMQGKTEVDIHQQDFDIVPRMLWYICGWVSLTRFVVFPHELLTPSFLKVLQPSFLPPGRHSMRREHSKK